jgi:hypothetical protein
MQTFEVKIVKNTLPYIQPYSIIAKTITGNNGHYVERSQIIGNYKNQTIAEKAKKNFEHLLINEILPPEFEDYKHWPNCMRKSHEFTIPQDNFSILDYFDKRMKSNKDGDSPPKLPPSKKRKIIL